MNTEMLSIVLIIVVFVIGPMLWVAKENGIELGYVASGAYIVYGWPFLSIPLSHFFDSGESMLIAFGSSILVLIATTLVEEPYPIAGILRRIRSWV